MMHPPRQMVAIAPRSMRQPYSSLPAWMWSKPCAYAMTLDAYSALRTSSMNPARSSTCHGLSSLVNVRRAAAR